MVFGDVGFWMRFCCWHDDLRPQEAASCGNQLGYSDEVVADQVEEEVAKHAIAASVLGLAHCPVLLAPAEDAFDHGSACLRHAVTSVPGRSPIDGALTPFGIAVVEL